jgi:hypothetical protein
MFDDWREYNRECTSFVAWALASRNGFNMPFYDNAVNWGARARARGIAVNGTPARGSVAWSSTMGHVAYVQDVNGGSVYIEEYNIHLNGTYDARWVPASAFTGYIHFKDLSAAAPPPVTPPPVTPPPVTPPPVTPPPVTTVVTVTTPATTTTPPPATTTTPPTTTTTTPPTTTTTPPPVQPPPVQPPPAVAETTGGVTHTWTNWTNAGGSEGPTIGSNATVQIACRLTGWTAPDGNNWWYRIAQSPWNGQYYASADAFYNNGATSGSLHGTPFVDLNVPSC